MMMSIPVRDLRDQSLITLTLPQHYGYCILIAIGSMVIVHWKSKRLALTNSDLFSVFEGPKSESLCPITTSHLTMVDEYPQFLTLLLLGGLDSPGTSAIGGTLYVLTQILSTVKCCKGDSMKRGCQALGHLGWVAMVASTARLALRLLRVI